MGGSVHLSIAPADLSVEKLLCLASLLTEEHPEWDNVAASIFTSNAAAIGYIPNDISEAGNFRGALRAIYSVDNGHRSLTITPIGTSSHYFKTTARGQTFGDQVYDTRIDLPFTGTPNCRLSVSDRCVLSLPAFDYPEEAWLTHSSGAVTLAAVAHPDGKVTVKLVNPIQPRQNLERDLIRAAINNVSDWLIDPSPHENEFEITFRYELDLTIPAGKCDVDVDLPRRVTIRASRQKPC